MPRFSHVFASSLPCQILVGLGLGLALTSTASSCGADASDPLTGNWNLLDARCDGLPATLPSGFASSVEYRADGTFQATMSGPACPSRVVTGRFTRQGLTLTESAETEDCGAGCVLALGQPINCSGTNALSGASARTVVELAISEADVMERLKPDPLSVCASASGRYVEESQTWQKQ